ncbi:related to FAM203 family [Lecanosticta acicola]|uniref:Protein HGH1 homolog n=1 Tax=Lecanosticta acicola TaxID=111012 RepID=A0AAI9EDL3_9PEZI|nr:related to FAM203 family [Lecanosticta acicola]
MPTELEELVEFLHHGNTQIRQIAAENLVGYSTAQPTLFKRNQLEPIKDLKLLVKDYGPIAKNALTMLVNVSEDSEVVKSLADDDAFIESILRRVTDAKEPNASLQCMLLANMAKASNITKLLMLKREVPKPLSTSPIAIDQLLDCFVKGASGSYNKNADYDYLCYLFADLAKHEEGRKHFLTARAEGEAAEVEDIIPLTKLVVFTEHASVIRRRGVASTIKNVSFDFHAHQELLAADGVNLLPYLLLPLMGSEEYSDDDSEGMLDECQLLPPDKERDTQPDIICIHLETLLLLASTPKGRKRLRDVKVYPIIRELHAHLDNEDVTEACDRLVQVLMRGEPGDPDPAEAARASAMAQEGAPRVQEIEEDEDEKIVDVV